MTSNLTCTAPGCSEPHYARGLCKPHYGRWWRTGSIEHPTLGFALRERASNRGFLTYKTWHEKLAELLGPASDQTCIDCGKQAAHWSYEYGCADEKQSEYGPWCEHAEHYAPRCIPCHTRQAIPRGEGHYKALHSDETIREIRQLVAEGMTQRAVARLFGLDYRYVHKVVTYQVRASA